MEELQKKYDTLVGKYNALLAENEELKSILLQHGIVYSVSEISDKEPIFSPVIFPSVNFTPDEKIALFSSFFKGRTDVFARRWFSRTTGKGGYQPVCTNEWQRGVCDKKRYKCPDCPNRNLAPLTSREIYRHLEGKDEYGCDVIGLYAVTPDNKCSFLCADFDDKNCTHGYKEDVLAFIAVCRNWGISYSIERSRSGNGAHVWIFFEEPVDPAGVDGRKEGVHAVGQVFVGALGAAIDIDLTLELTALILGGQPFQLMDELITGRFRDDPAGLDSVHQKLQLRQLERPRRHPIAAAAAPAQPDVIAQRVQRVDVAVDAFSLAEDALPGQQLHQLRHIQQMLLVGLLLKDMQQRQQFGFLSLLLGHGRPPLRSRVLFVECGAALGG